MLIEIHMIQNHGPSNLNRDDLGAPKTCIFGGVTRARISSQCLKRSIRRSPEFAAALESDGGVRTRRLIEEIARVAAGKGNDPSETDLTAIRNVFKEGGVGLDKNDVHRFDILFFVPQSAINEMGAAVGDKGGDLGKKFAGVIGKFVQTPDIALCGRMTEFDAQGPFAALKGKFTVEAALSAAHAISTHAVVNEVDYFAAADDVPGLDAGAGHLSEAVFNSACFYKHFSIDWEQLLNNLGGDAELATTTVKCFLEGAVKANPSGKQHAYAAFNSPEGVLVEVKAKPCAPMSYANAFADPVPERSQRGLIGESIARLGQYVHDVVTGYGVVAQRFWFSPNDRYALKYIDGKQEKAVGGVVGEGKFATFVDKVMGAVKDGKVAAVKS